MNRQPEIEEDNWKEPSENEAEDVNNLQKPHKKIKTEEAPSVQPHPINLVEDNSFSFPSFSFQSTEFKPQNQFQPLNNGFPEQESERNDSSTLPRNMQGEMSFIVQYRQEFEEEESFMYKNSVQDSNKQGQPVSDTIFRQFQEMRSEFVHPKIIQENAPYHQSEFKSMQSLMAFMDEKSQKNQQNFEQPQDRAIINSGREENGQQIKEPITINLSIHNVQNLVGILHQSSRRVGQPNQENIVNSKENEKETAEAAIEGLFANSRVLKKMGAGAHGTVLKIESEDGKIRVIKLFKKKPDSEYFREVRILSKTEEMAYRERHALEKYGTRVFESKDYYGIIFEAGIAPLSKFKQFLKDSQRKLSEKGLLSLFFALWGAVKLLLEKGICHRDIKPDNIVLHGRNLELELIDFSLSLPINQKEKIIGCAGTRGYLDPYLVKNYENKIASSYEEFVEADLYSIGVIILEFADYDFRPGPDLVEKEILVFLKEKKKLPHIAKLLEILLFGKKKIEALEVFVKEFSQSSDENKRIFQDSLYPKEPPKFNSGFSECSTEFKEYLGIRNEEENSSKKYESVFSDPGFDGHSKDLKRVREAEWFESRAIQLQKARITCYENALKRFIASGEKEKGQKLSEKILNEVLQDESINWHPLLYSTLGIQLSMEEKGEKALEMFSKGLELAKSNKDKSILFNNIECLTFQKLLPQNRMGDFREAFRLSNNDQDGSNNGYLISRRWLEFSWENRVPIHYNFLQVPDEEDAEREEDEMRNTELVLSFRDLSQKEPLLEAEEYKLNTIVFFNFSFQMASKFCDSINQRSENYENLLKKINTFCFYFNREKSRKLNKIVKFEGNVDFFIKIFDLVLLFKDELNIEPDIGEDSKFLNILRDDSNWIYEINSDLYDVSQRGQTSFMYQVMLEYCPFLLLTFIGLPLVFKPCKNLKQKWDKSFFLLEKTRSLSKVTDIVKLEYKINQYPIDSDFDERPFESFFDFEESECEFVSELEKSESELDLGFEKEEPDRISYFDFRKFLERNPLIDILETEEVKEFEITSLNSPFLISSQAYKYKGVLEGSMESRLHKWSLDGISILIGETGKKIYSNDTGENEDPKACQKWVEENISKMKPIKDLEMAFVLENSSEKPFQVLNGFDVLSLSRLELQIQFHRGESNYPVVIITDFIKSQKEIEELTLYNSSVSLEMREIVLLQDAIKEHQKLRKVLLYFNDCSRINEEKVLPLIQSIAKLPSLKNVTISLRNCASIPHGFKITLQEQFKTLDPAEITINVTHEI